MVSRGGQDIKRAFFSAGEPSGELYSAALAKAMMHLDPGLRVFGFGSSLMRRAGVDVVMDNRGMAVVGFAEAAAIWRKARVFRQRILDFLVDNHVELLVVTDYPDFHVPLVSEAAARGISCVFYGCPSAWAWRAKRMDRMVSSCRLIVPFLPFEPDLYEKRGGKVLYEGHPLIDLVKSSGRGEARSVLGIEAEATVVGIFPGSRYSEISTIGPVIKQAIEKIAQNVGTAVFVIPVADGLDPDSVRKKVIPGDVDVHLINGLSHQVMYASDAMIVASGTATLESAVAGTPFTTCYKVHPVTYFLLRMLVHRDIRSITLPNLILGRECVPEYIQDIDGDILARDVIRLLEDPSARDEQKKAFDDIRSRLGNAGVAGRVAEYLVSMEL